MKKVIAILILANILFLGITFLRVAQALTPCEQYCEDYNTYIKTYDPVSGTYGGAKPQELQGLTCICNPLTYTTFQEIIEGIVNYLFTIASIIAPAMIVVGAILFMTAGGSPERVKTAKRVILWTVVGFLIILFSKGLINLVNYIIGVK